jgi:hypothetical protein
MARHAETGANSNAAYQINVHGNLSAIPTINRTEVAIGIYARMHTVAGLT